MALTYNGYIGSIEICHEDHCLYGQVLDLPDNTMISYEGQTMSELEQDFKGTIDDYLSKYL